METGQIITIIFLIVHCITWIPIFYIIFKSIVKDIYEIKNGGEEDLL